MARANAIYYATHDPFADFTTSPEISQVFGEIIGLWAAVTWQLLGMSRPGDAGGGRPRPRHTDGRCAARGARRDAGIRGGARGCI